MTENDKEQFKNTIYLMTDGFNLPRFKGKQLHEWFDGLSDYSIDDVIKKIDHYIEMHNELPTLEAIKKHDVTIRPKAVTPLTVENNKGHMKDVKQLTNKKGVKDNLAWAHKLLARPNITEFQRNFANKALGNK